MNIQIGMRCAPDWLCQGIGWVLAITVILLLLGLIKVIIRQVRAEKGKKKRR